MSNYYVDPLSSYPTLEQLSRLECDQWLQLGVRLGLDNDQLETIKKSQHPTAASLQAAKIKNIDMQWKDIVEALVNIREYTLAESVCTQQGQQINMSLVQVLYNLQYYCLVNSLIYCKRTRLGTSLFLYINLNYFLSLKLFFGGWHL